MTIRLRISAHAFRTYPRKQAELLATIGIGAMTKRWIGAATIAGTR